MAVKAVSNPHRISLIEFLADNGYDSVGEFVESEEDMLTDSVQPALCDEGCEVEPDGRCEHGCPSISLVLGII